MRSKAAVRGHIESLRMPSILGLSLSAEKMVKIRNLIRRSK